MLQIDALSEAIMRFAIRSILVLAFVIAYLTTAVRAESPRHGDARNSFLCTSFWGEVVFAPSSQSDCGFWCHLVDNIPEIIKTTIQGNWLGMMALVIIVTTVVVVVLSPRDPNVRKKIVYIFLIAAILLVGAAFHEAVRQQDRLDISHPVVAQAATSTPNSSPPSEGVNSSRVVEQGSPQSTHQEAPPPAHQNWCSEDPETKIPYSREIVFKPGDPPYKTGKVRGGDANTPGSEWIFNWTAPGPVYSVTARQTGWWEQIDSCSAEGSVAHCEGWINGGNAPIIVTVKWKQPCAAASP